MPLLQCKCPNCGANIKIDENQKKGICEHCGTEYVTEDIINNYQTINHYNTTQNITKKIYGSDRLEADELIHNGDVFISLNEFAKAEEAYNKAIRLNPADWRGWFGIVKCATNNFTNYTDKTHLEYLDKAKTVANEKERKEIDELYNPFKKEKEELTRKEYQEYITNRNSLERLKEETQKKKKKKIKIVSIVAIICIIIVTACILIGSFLTPGSDDYKLKINDDGTITITQCNHAEAITIIPEEIDGRKVTVIGPEAFINSKNIEDITLPTTITEIGEKAFYNSNKLAVVRLKSVTPPLLGDKAFNQDSFLFDGPMNIKIYVPNESLSAYKNAWEDYENLIYPESPIDNEPEKTIFNITYNLMYDNKIEEDTYDTNKGLTLKYITRLGYNFEGWYLEETFTNKIEKIDVGTKVDIIVYAKWDPKQVLLSYDGNGSTSGSMDNQLMTIGETYVLLDNMYEREGYTFVGWTKDETSNEIIENKSSYTMEPTTYEIIKLYAKWAKDIYNFEDLNTINDNNTCFYTLKNDIDLTNKDIATIQEFFGIFNGNGYTLKNSENAIFVSNYGQINNLQLENCKYSEFNLYIGGFVAYNKGIINNCASNNEIDTQANTSGNIYIGGFCGFNNGSIISSKANTNIYATNGRIGGFIGSTSGYVLNCYATGSISAQSSSPGMATEVSGFICDMGASNGIINNCYSNVDIEASCKYVAGFLVMRSSLDVVIKNCFAIGDIKAIADYKGGFSYMSIPSSAMNIFRSDNNLFADGNVSPYGELVELSQFYTTQFYKTNNMFDAYVDDENLQYNSDAVWIINEGELPKLYWETKL